MNELGKLGLLSARLWSPATCSEVFTFSCRVRRSMRAEWNDLMA